MHAGAKVSVLVLFCYSQTALNADAMFEFHLHDCDKGLQPIILLCKTGTEKNPKTELRKNENILENGNTMKLKTKF